MCILKCLCDVYVVNMYRMVVHKEAGHAVTAEPISATAGEWNIFCYGISSLNASSIIGGYILSVGCVGTRLG